MLFIIPIYILGLLLRFGPQHGYQIKKTIAEQLSDFTQIKLPVIYYHLEKMQTDGLLNAVHGKENNRPEKTVYEVTNKGKAEFQSSLKKLMDFKYRPTFNSDAAFYFSDSLDNQEIIEHLQSYIKELNVIISAIQKHKNESIQFIPDEMRIPAEIIFNHHELHYNAELDWASDALEKLN